MSYRISTPNGPVRIQPLQPGLVRVRLGGEGTDYFRIEGQVIEGSVTFKGWPSSEGFGPWLIHQANLSARVIPVSTLETLLRWGQVEIPAWLEAHPD